MRYLRYSLQVREPSKLISFFFPPSEPDTNISHRLPKPLKPVSNFAHLLFAAWLFSWKNVFVDCCCCEFCKHLFDIFENKLWSREIHHVILGGFHCHFNHFSDRGKIAHFMPKKKVKNVECSPQFIIVIIIMRLHFMSKKGKKHLLDRNSFVLLGKTLKRSFMRWCHDQMIGFSCRSFTFSMPIKKLNKLAKDLRIDSRNTSALIL